VFLGQHLRVTVLSVQSHLSVCQPIHVAVLIAAPTASFQARRQVFSANYLSHRYRYLENATIVWMDVIADLLIGTAYIEISCTLAYLVYVMLLGLCTINPQRRSGILTKAVCQWHSCSEHFGDPGPASRATFGPSRDRTHDYGR
jgi:hypothetical protein